MRILRTMLAVVILSAAAGEAVSSPGYVPLTPRSLAEMYEAVIATEVMERDFEAGTMTLKVTEVFKGTFAPKTVNVTTTEVTHEEVIFLDTSQLIAAYVSRRGRGKAERIIFYTGGGIWQEAEIVGGDPSRWTWTRVRDEQTVGALFHAFHGGSERLVEMMADLKRGAYYFPRRPFHKYAQVTVGSFGKPLRGVALYDVDGDGDLDAYGCSPAGNRLYVQGEPLTFSDATVKRGLDGIAGVSCSFADADADGRADLLADGAIYAQNADGRFSKTAWLPPAADRAVKSSAFVELNGDGYPDVVVSQIEGGLHAYLNPGKGGGAFEDATESLGLAKEDCGAGGTGFFAPGDSNADGRCDLYYGVGKGLLLMQTEDGTFEPGPLGLDLRAFREEAGMTGAGAVAPVWRNDRMSLLAVMNASFALLAFPGGRPTNVTCYTGELENEPVEQQISVLCEDLDADGNVDVLTGTREDACNYHCNRGYGLFLCVPKYDLEALPGTFRTGAWGLAAGDANDDGANDILLGGVDGTLALLVNQTLSLRKTPTAKTRSNDRKRYDVTILAVDVKGPVGVTGARLVLKDAEKRPVALRVIGNNVNVGSCGSDRVNLAVREDGKYVLTVTWSDGVTRDVSVTVGRQRRMPVPVERPD